MAQEKSKSNAKAKIDAKSIIEELKTPGLIIVGMIGGNFAGKMLDKVLKVDETATGFNAKALVKPIVQISVGVGGALFLKDKNLKLIASGVAASGIASTVKVFLKKDVLQGLTNFAGLGNTIPDFKQVFREPVNLQIEAYNPSLPMLTGGDDTEIEGIETLAIESEMSGTDLGEYQEIKEVTIL